MDDIKVHPDRWMRWLSSRPVAMLSFIMLMTLTGLVGYQLFRPLDVLTDWDITIIDPVETRKVGDRTLPVFRPNDTLLIRSTSHKLMDTSGTATRSLICEENDINYEHEIFLDASPVGRKPGATPFRDNAIILPDVAQYDGLPRVCKLHVSIVYRNVALFRHHTEEQSSPSFIIEEFKLDREQIAEKVLELSSRIEQLKDELERMELTGEEAIDGTRFERE